MAETGKPGAANGVDEGERLTGANGTSQRDDGVVGGEGDKKGQVGGAYVELKPRGNLVPQSGARVHIDYKATRFEGAWTPKGESSVDTAIRRGVEATTVKTTISLPRGIRINCVAGPGNAGGAMKAVSLFTIGCGGDPPPKPANRGRTGEEPDHGAREAAGGKPAAGEQQHGGRGTGGSRQHRVVHHRAYHRRSASSGLRGVDQDQRSHRCTVVGIVGARERSVQERPVQVGRWRISVPATMSWIARRRRSNSDGSRSTTQPATGAHNATFKDVSG